MKKIKFLLYFIIFIGLTIIVTSNWAFFSNMQVLDINLYKPVYKWPFEIKLQKLSFHFPAVATGLYLLGCFIVGFLFSSFGNLVTRFKNTKQIKQLQATNNSQTEALESLKKEVGFLQRNASKPSPPKAAAETEKKIEAIEKSETAE